MCDVNCVMWIVWCWLCVVECVMSIVCDVNCDAECVMASVCCRMCHVECVMSIVWCQVCEFECVMLIVWSWVCDVECVMLSMWCQVCDFDCVMLSVRSGYSYMGIGIPGGLHHHHPGGWFNHLTNSRLWQWGRLSYSTIGALCPSQQLAHGTSNCSIPTRAATLVALSPEPPVHCHLWDVLGGLPWATIQHVPQLLLRLQQRSIEHARSAPAEEPNPEFALWLCSILA